MTNHTPDNFRPAGASDHPGWEAIAALLLASASRTADISTAPAEQKAVRAVNEMLAAMPPITASEDRLPGIGARVQQSGVYGGTRLGTVVKSRADVFTVKWDKRTVDCTYDLQYLRGDAQCPIKIFDATPPSSDAAEGAGTFPIGEDTPYWHTLRAALSLPVEDQHKIATDLAANCGYELTGDAYSVPPKPAPDAMREYVARLREIGDWLVAKENVHDASALYSIARALSAPVAAYYVPSPDGAGDVRELVDQVLYQFENDGRTLYPDNEVIIAIEKIRSALSPYPTGAAEPDAVRTLIVEACDLLAERKYGNPARSAGHNARLALEAALRLPACAPAVRDEHHIARFLARLIYRRGVAYGPGLESADTWVDANWQAFREDARRLLTNEIHNSDGGGESRPADGAKTPTEKNALLAELSNSVGAGVAPGASEAIAPAVGVTREAMKNLLISAKLLQQNSEACAANHYGSDCETFGLPGWLADTKKDIEAAEASLPPVPDATVSGTPAAHSRADGKPDPHRGRYDCERAALPGGQLTDEQLANEVYLNPSLTNLTLAKERIRWLSRKLESAPQDVGREATVEGEPWPDHPGATVDAVAFVEADKRYPQVDRDSVTDLSFADKQADRLGAFIEGFKRALQLRPPPSSREATVEAFAKSLESRAAGYAARGDSIFNGSIIAEELTEQARRLRSLAANGGGRE